MKQLVANLKSELQAAKIVKLDFKITGDTYDWNCNAWQSFKLVKSLFTFNEKAMHVKKFEILMKSLEKTKTFIYCIWLYRQNKYIEYICYKLQ